MSSTREEANLQLFSNVPSFFFLLHRVKSSSTLRQSRLSTFVGTSTRNLGQRSRSNVRAVDPPPPDSRTDCASHFNTAAFFDFIFEAILGK